MPVYRPVLLRRTQPHETDFDRDFCHAAAATAVAYSDGCITNHGFAPNGLWVISPTHMVFGFLPILLICRFILPYSIHCYPLISNSWTYCFDHYSSLYDHYPSFILYSVSIVFHVLSATWKTIVTEYNRSDSNIYFGLALFAGSRRTSASWVRQFLFLYGLIAGPVDLSVC